jgi:hypothetical protein
MPPPGTMRASWLLLAAIIYTLLLAPPVAAGHAQAAQFEVRVSPTHGPPAGASAAGAGALPQVVGSVHAAASAAEALQAEHPGAEVTVRLLPGVHALAGHPLIPGHRQRWVGGVGGEPSVLSGGASVTGWRPLSPPSDRIIGTSNLTRWVAELPRGACPKTLRAGQVRAPQVTWPSTHWPAQRQFLYARTVARASNGSAGGPPQANVGIDERSLPAGWASWTDLVAYTYPAESWVGMRMLAKPNPHPPDGMSTGEARFTFTCPDGFAGLKPGNRIVFAGPPSMLGVRGTSGVWAADEAAGQVHYLSDQVPEDVWVPIQSRLVTIENRSSVSFDSVTFVDVDFNASGVQTGFNRVPSDKGCPHDAAVALSNSQNVTLQRCNFTAVGGGAVLVGNRSTQVVVSDSRFTQIGQSGVMFVGASPVPSGCPH